MRIVSVPGRLVRDPTTNRPVDADGLTVDETNVYWSRLLADGDVQAAPEVTEEPAPAAPAPVAEEPKA